jgi:hypothetical protein
MVSIKWIAGLLAVSVCIGCSGGAKPETVPVKGKVTYQGSPVESGRITFQPKAGGESRPASGSIEPGGLYQLSSFETGDGAKPGDYTVVVDSFTGGPSPEEPNAKTTWLVPEKYSKPNQSGLTANIPADAKPPVEIDFDLE